MLQALPKGSAVRTAAVACAQDKTTLEAVAHCVALGAIQARLIGDVDKIRQLLQEIGETPETYEILPAEDPAQAAKLAVAAVAAGKADFILKGKVDTSVLLKAVVDRDAGLYSGRLMSHLAFVWINIIVIVMSFVTAADATLTNLGSLCVKNVPIGTEPPAKVKVVWGVVIGAMAVVLAAFGGGAQGLDGVKSLATIGGAVVFVIFALQIISAIKTFFGKSSGEEIYSLPEDAPDNVVED
jgi:hypothetical protein